ncbi:MAG: ABC transporter ATP-binding protein [Rhizobiales bacterium]|nr:ABC transporter ATP-binding protein [Hyphomicrobiales bacterium]NRB13931.1 ABC transporter ATP-binding protein [Hyphomicrobiales bacterium]
MSGETKFAFRTENLVKTYGQGDGQVDALRGVNVEIPAKEFVVLLGPSGSGKSTLLNILGGLDKPTSGKVYFNDIEVSAMKDKAMTKYRRHNVGFIFQQYNLLPSLTALENVELVTEIAKQPLPAKQALEMVGLTDRMNHFPSQMSGGELQRVAIARAIAKQPSVLFCDEPTGALDSQTGRTILNILQDINENLGTSIIIVTHAVATAAMADRVINFADGNIVDIRTNAHKAKADEIEW